MANHGVGKLVLTYKPLESLDELQLLLLTATAEGNCGIALLERMFSLPSAVIVREMEQLAVFGLLNEEHRKNWTCSSRGRRVVSIWEAFKGKSTLSVEVSSSDWSLGPGIFAVPSEVETAHDVGNLAEEDTRLDEKVALEIIASEERDEIDSGRRGSEQGERRYRAAVGVAVFSWLCKQPDPIGSVAESEPSGFVCQVSDWQIHSPAPSQSPAIQEKVKQASGSASAASSRSRQVSFSSDGLIDKLISWFFG